jgi:hypothetical protein
VGVQDLNDEVGRIRLGGRDRAQRQAVDDADQTSHAPLQVARLVAVAHPVRLTQ